MTLEPIEKKSVHFFEDPDMPLGTIEKYIEKAVNVINGVKFLVETRKYIIKVREYLN